MCSSHLWLLLQPGMAHILLDEDQYITLYRVGFFHSNHDYSVRSAQLRWLPQGDLSMATQELTDKSFKQLKLPLRCDQEQFKRIWLAFAGTLVGHCSRECT